MDRNLYLNKAVDSEICSELVRQIIEINEEDDKAEDEYFEGIKESLEKCRVYGNIEALQYEREPIHLYIDSPGGYVYNGFGLVNIIRNSRTPIYTIVTGHAMSMAFLIALAGDLRFGYKDSTWMYHEGSFGIWSDATEIKRELAESDRLDKKYDELVKECSYLEQSFLDDIKSRRENKYFDGNDAVKYALVDELLDHEPDAECNCDFCGCDLEDCVCDCDE